MASPRSGTAGTDLISLMTMDDTASIPSPPMQYKHAEPPAQGNGLQRDSFSHLAGLMKAKKPYTATPAPSPPVEPVESFLQKQEMAVLTASSHRQNALLIDNNHLSTQIGELRCQGEANGEQKAAMGRSLAQQEVEIKKQQLEIDSLNQTIADLKTEVGRQQKELGEVDKLRSTINEFRHLKETIKELTLERDQVVRAQVNSGDHALRAQNLADTLAKREKLITDLRQKTLEEQMRATDLEDEVDRLREQVDQGSVDDLKGRLCEKTSQCDRYRNQLKVSEQQLKLSQSRLLAAMNGGESLRGGAHLVAPHQNGNLPKAVISCSECYARNTTCDSRTVCRPCIESNSKCSRWRCSLKQKLGECNMAPCVFPHDSQGWLVMTEPRPQW